MAPLVSDKKMAADQVEVEVELDGRKFILMMSDLFATESRRLRKLAGSLSNHEDELRRAIERLFNGF